MPIEIASVGSSSSGNSYIIMAGGAALLLDAGLPAKRITAALEHLGIAPEEVEAVLVTHEHIDHVRSVRTIAKKCCNAIFYASRGTAERAESFGFLPQERIRITEAGDSFELYSDNCNNVRINAFALSHDAAEPIGFSVEAGGEKLSVVTDTGIVSEALYEAVKDSDILVLESNHDEHMLMFGDYPYNVKVRIRSEFGHLSNEYAAEVLAKLMAERKGSDAPLRIMLAHLSFRNNVPLFARQAAEDRLSEEGFVKGRDYTLTVAAKEGLTFAE